MPSKSVRNRASNGNTAPSTPSASPAPCPETALPSAKERPRGVVITVPDPDNKPVLNIGHTGGTLQFRTETHNYSRFEIQFHGANPFNADCDAIFTGDDLHPVIHRVENAGEFTYTIVQHQRSAKRPSHKSAPIPFRVVSCTGCEPPSPPSP